MITISTLKLTTKQLNLLQEIAKSHSYFPEIALDDLTFKNSFYVPKDPCISDMLERNIITKKGKSLGLHRITAKRFWNEIISMIPIDNKYNPVSFEFLRTRDIEILRTAYHTLTDESGEDLDKESLIEKIINCYQVKTEEKVRKMATKEKAVKEPKAKKNAPIDDGKLTPKEISTEYGVPASQVRKVIRNFMGGKATDGNWRLTKDEAEKVMEAHQKAREEASKRRSERMAELQAKRKAKAAENADTKAPAKAKKAPAKKVAAE